MNAHGQQVLALSGGIGGAKLALGLYQSLPEASLNVLCNTGDDFTHLGLNISPDIDTVLYTLAGLSNRQLGWGREGETWTFMDALQAIGGETWFRLGDGDLALHVERTRRLSEGERLSEIVDVIRQRLQIHAQIMPMCDRPVPTRVNTEHGTLPFQQYFVKLQCEPAVTGFEFSDVQHAEPTQALRALLSSGNLQAIVICPSNPFISIDPILAVPGLRDALRECTAPVVAVSPVIGGQSVKGPTAKMMAELALPVSAGVVAEHYGDLLDGFVLDNEDAQLANALSVPCCVAQTWMRTDMDKRELAQEVLAFAQTLRER
ncbi:MAG: LPPG:FO 2-phospho-L-lactate transferase [Gammaproteobacteria bacterium]